MRKYLLTISFRILATLFLLSISNITWAQSGTKPAYEPQAVSDSGIYRKVAIKAEPNFNWNQYLQESLKFPKEFIEEKVSVKIYLELIIEKNGKVSSSRALRIEDQINNNKATADQLKPFIDEACRVALESPKWIPAIEDGRAVRSYFVISILFNRN